jgi:hypothetical protein
MTDETITAFKRDGQRLSVELIGCLLGALALLALVAIKVLRQFWLTDTQALAIFAASAAIAVIGAWRQAIIDGRLPPPLRPSKVKHDHITGWGFIAIAMSVSVIIALASWAAPHQRDIGANMSVYVVIGLAMVFLIAALAPPINISDARSLLHRIGAFVHPFGLLLSAIDSFMVFAVAGSAGVTQRWLALRYGILLSVMGASTALGFILSPPYGLIPLAWGFLVAISISRRWGWVEEDRDLYMLNRSVGAHLRVGFGEDLRDEALLSFTFMFVLIPLALRQAQGWSNGALFEIHLNHPVGIMDWVAFFGGELAKAAPFVDWAEVYGVQGDEQFLAKTEAAKHVIFAMRVLLDLVFLAALVQALSIAARNAKQMELFNAGTLDRLDPFTEPREFRKLIRRGSGGAWEIIPEAIAKFPKYDTVRLAELSDKEFAPFNIAAIALRRRDGSDEAARFTDQLLNRAYAKQKDVDAIEEVLNAIRVSRAPVLVEDLDRARIQLNGRRPFNSSRETIMRLIANAPRSKDRFAAIRSCLVGMSEYGEGQPVETIRDAVGSVRRVAAYALREDALAGDTETLRLLEEVAQKDAATLVRRAAREILDERNGNPRGADQPAIV